MKIGILADIHANCFALERVIDDCKRLAVEKFFFLGDFVGYYYWPKEVLDMISGLGDFVAIGGNHEEMLREAMVDQSRRVAIKAKYGSGIDIAIETLNEQEKRFLSTLPSTRALRIDGVNFLLCHGSPTKIDQYIYPDASESELSGCFGAEADVVLLGHTHYPFVLSQKDRIIANPGSVGQPRDVGSLASYFVFDTKNRSMVPRRVAFDNEPILAEIAKIDPENQYLGNILRRNV